MPHLPFVTYDVFTDRRFAGNPLAVVFDADALDAETMQRVAREFNLSETVFVRTPANEKHAAAVRIFTPGRELPFAGHPTIGSAIAIAERRMGRAEIKDAILVLEERVGPVRCAVKVTQTGASFAEFDAPKLAEESGLAGTDEAFAEALDLKPEDIGFDRHIPTIYDAGVRYACVPIASLDALARARPMPSASADMLGCADMYLYARAPDEETHAFQARMYAPAFGIPEDPATGSAAAAIAGALARFEGLMDGWHTLPILQGVEMGRPSLIGLEIELAQGLLNGVRIGGKAVQVSEGTISI
ncbi:MAG: PhzF family phenazine biosynthesis protein [Hyphomonadaceae bacterium]